MAQPTVKLVWKTLVEMAAALRLFTDVRALPVNSITNVKFLDSFPGITMPCCLIACLGRSRTIRGSGDERIVRYSAIFAQHDPKGVHALDFIDLVEQWESAMLDRQILNEDVTIHGTNEIRAAASNPRYNVYELAFETRQAAERSA